MTRFSHFTDVWFYSIAQRKRGSQTQWWKETKEENGEMHSERAREISLHQVCIQEFVYKSDCICTTVKQVCVYM